MSGKDILPTHEIMNLVLLGKGDLNHISWFNTIYWHICKSSAVIGIAKPNSKKLPTK